MSLRKSPERTPAMLAANRANARKSTGPRTPEGKRRILLNALRHGHRSRHLLDTLDRLSLGAQLDFSRIYVGLYRVLCPGPGEAGWVLPTAAYVWRVKRSLERKVRSAEFRARVAGQKWLPRPWRWRLYRSGRRITVTVCLRRGRCPAGTQVYPAYGWDGKTPLHVAVMLYTSDHQQWTRLGWGDLGGTEQHTFGAANNPNRNNNEGRT